MCHAIYVASKKKTKHGEEYVNVTNKVIPRKEFSNLKCTCRKECCDRITEKARREAFLKFWKIGNFWAQNAFLCGVVQQNQTKVHHPRNGIRGVKNASNVYFISTVGPLQDVCKQYLLDIYKISNGLLMRALKRGRVSSPGEDLRGKHQPVNKTPMEKFRMYEIIIRSFPAYQSHYMRAHNRKRKYLDAQLNICIMYNLYKERKSV